MALHLICIANLLNGKQQNINNLIHVLVHLINKYLFRLNFYVVLTWRKEIMRCA